MADDSTRRGRTRLRSFHELMQRRVQRILLISSLYDSFIMSEEGQLHETLLSQFVDLNLSQIPDLIHVATIGEARELIEEEGQVFDMIVSSLTTTDGDAVDLAEALRDAEHPVPVLGLAYTSRELAEFTAARDTSALDRLFLWQGDVRILLAMVKYVEDRLNVERDTKRMGVPVIIVVEDRVRYYSSFLPTIYAELLSHTQRLLSEDLSLSQKMMRMRARPKLLLCETFEEASADFAHFEEQVLGVISDFEYPRDGVLDPHAGVELCRRIHEARSDVRLVMQSSVPSNEAFATELGASFLLKGSPLLLQDLRTILVKRFGFGDFTFRLPDGSEVEHASDLKDLLEKLRVVPAESIAYHAERNHFSNWLKARTEFTLAERLRPRKLAEFRDVEELRAHMLDVIEAFRVERNRSVIADFDRERFDPTVSFTRIGTGSLGGKARGVAFANRILQKFRIDDEFPGVDIHVPPCVVLGTQVFDEYLEYGQHLEFALAGKDDEDVIQQFVAAPFPRSAITGLRAFLQHVKYPLAVRSSSLLEDSLSQPFAGVYQTYMLANNAPDLDARWEQLASAVKRVWASTFLAQARSYLDMTSFRLEEEKMAVMIQELVGNQHGDRFYPDFAGVARSYNFYPEPDHSAEDGVAAVALGLGHTVVGGDPCLSFCPRHPQHIVGFSSVESTLETAQREFRALDISRRETPLGLAEIRRFGLDAAEEDGTLGWLGSTYSPNDHSISDGIARAGIRLVSFAQVLKHEAYPLAKILRVLLEHCQEGTGAPVEIEFAGNLARPGRKASFAFLQLRPLALSKESTDVEIGDPEPASVVCRSDKVLGNGRIDDIRDVVAIDLATFERARTPEIALEVARFDATLRKQERPYLLVGVGRWGTSDPSLGIPVGWNHISGARVIVESGLPDLKVVPSQGTHFFQNLSSSGVAYFTVNPDANEGTLDWTWIASLPEVERTRFVRWCRVDEPLTVKVRGMTTEGVILKPGAPA